MPPDTALYDTDVYAWAQHQAALLREACTGPRSSGAFAELDLVNLAEEIDSLGINQRHALGSHLRTILLHLLKWRYQPQKRQTGHSWQSSITRVRDEIALRLEASPSLERDIPALLVRRYPAARRLASQQTRLPLATFPITCPWTVEEILDADFWPEADTP
jgi:hypothetical protein